MKKAFAFIFLFGVVIAASAQTSSASFLIDKANLRTSCKSLNGVFINRSTCGTGHVCRYVWNWGDGKKNDTIKTTANALHTFEKDGRFTITLSVIDSATKQVLATKPQTDYIKIYKPDAQDFTDKEDTVSFQHTFEAPTAFKPFDKAAWLYEWTWDDGSAIFTDTTNKTRHLFPAEKFGVRTSYNVKLKIKINEEYFDTESLRQLSGCQDSMVREIEITDAFFTDATKKNAVGSRIPNLPNIITPDASYGEFSLDSTESNPELKSNDIWYFKSDGQDVFTFKVYNRWGSLVFEKIGKVIYWDGVDMSEDPVQSGVYYYVIESTQTDKRHNRTGFIHVFRED